jgi:predicted transcriptional regulator
VVELETFLSPLIRRTASGPSSGALTRFTDIAGALEAASGAIARLDALLIGHPLEPAWLWRIRLEAVRRQAAIDGRVIDPWHLAAVIEGVRFRMDRSAAIIERGAIFEAARHALGLWRWFARPSEAQTEAIGCAAATLPAAGQGSPLLGAALGVRAWLDHDGERPPLRAALALYWQRCGLLHLACPLLTGAKTLDSETPREIEAWTVRFLAALAEEAETGTGLLRLMEREWFAARSAVRDRRRDSRAFVAVDIMAAAPVISATSLAGGLGIAVKNASALLEALVERGIAIEVTHRSKRRLYGLKDLAPLREEAAPPRRPTPGRSRGRPPRGAPVPILLATYSEARDATPPPADRLALSPLERKEFDFTDIDRWMQQADEAIRRTKAVLDRIAVSVPVGPRQSDGA